LELGIPLRWPGAWRRRFIGACRAALPLLAAGAGEVSGAPGEPPAPQPTSCRLQFAGAPFSGLVGVTPDGGARLLLFPSEGGLFLFTGERARGLTIAPAPAGRITLDYAGPLLRFPDTVQFLDLERGLASAHLVDADVRLAFTPAPACGETGSFGTDAGSVGLGGRRTRISRWRWRSTAASGSPSTRRLSTSCRSSAAAAPPPCVSSSRRAPSMAARRRPAGAKRGGSEPLPRRPIHLTTRRSLVRECATRASARFRARHRRPAA